ncbi:MAG TPA: squalene/phytoene synthase family protein [Stellaceae bacterium]|jgi:phytoene synthase|nr:squalene/phytoene synthase family protein [Stellaceae bacterium]
MAAIAETTTGAETLAALLRRHDYDRYLMALFAPTARRPAVQAIYAFNYEIARIRETVREPMLGQIRLEWWREGIAAAFAEGPVRRHEVLTPLAEAIRQWGLSRDPFDRLIDARYHDLSTEPPATLAALESYAEETSAPLQLLVLETLDAAGVEANRAAREAAIAYALTGLLRATPFLARSSRHSVPPSLAEEPKAIAERAKIHLAAARALRTRISRAALPALLPAVLAAADLARLGRAGFDPFADALTRRDPWRAWRLAIAVIRGRY